ncbi:hypothetical protein ACJX0J_018389, partial [Zea mays]
WQPKPFLVPGTTIRAMCGYGSLASSSTTPCIWLVMTDEHPKLIVEMCSTWTSKVHDSRRLARLCQRRKQRSWRPPSRGPSRRSQRTSRRLAGHGPRGGLRRDQVQRQLN